MIEKERIEKQRREQVRKRGLPPLLVDWSSGGKPLFLTCSIWVVPQFEKFARNYAEAFANFSPGFELARTLGSLQLRHSNPERVSPTAEPFQGLITIF